MVLTKIIDKIKRKFNQKQYLKDKRFPAFWFDKLLGNTETFIVQIGSNDGKMGDPIYPLLQKNKRWKALFVEPVPYLFEKLKNNYSDTSRFICENVAITKGKENLTFFWVDPKAKNSLPDLPYWYDQLGSFDKQHILKHLGGVLEPFILSAQLECMNLQSLFRKNNILNIDILHIDTEGYDWNILSQLNWEYWQPFFILYEHNHLSVEDLKASYKFLEDRYHLFKIGIDILAVNKQCKEIDIKKMTKYINKA